LEVTRRDAAETTGDVSVDLNGDFISTRLDPQTLQGMVQAHQAGGLPLDELLQAMRDGRQG
jgi:hypothetical protein